MPSFVRTIVYKVIYYVVIWFVAVSVAFAIPRLLPYNAVEYLVLQMESSLAHGGAAVNPLYLKEATSYIEDLFGTNKPVWEQYIDFWDNLFHGNLGISIIFFPKPVSQVIAEALPYDLLLLLPSTITAWVIGNLVGAYVGYRKTGTLSDRATMITFTALNNIPFFILALILVIFFSIDLRWLPPTGYTFSAIPKLTWQYIPIFLRHWILPYFSVTIVSLGGWALGMRGLIINEKNSDYMNYGEALGMKQSVLSRYAMKNAFLPQVTGLALSLGTIVGGSYVLEFIFEYPGMGYIMGYAATANDYITVQGVFVVIATVVLLANLIVDILYYVLDPRVRAAEVS